MQDWRCRRWGLWFTVLICEDLTWMSNHLQILAYWHFTNLANQAVTIEYGKWNQPVRCSRSSLGLWAFQCIICIFWVVYCGIFHDKLVFSWVELWYFISCHRKYRGQHDQCNVHALHDGNVGYNLSSNIQQLAVSCLALFSMAWYQKLYFQLHSNSFHCS